MASTVGPVDNVVSPSVKTSIPLTAFDGIIDDLNSIDTATARLEDLEAMVLRIHGVSNQAMKRLVSDVRKLTESARDHHLEKNIAAYRQWTPMVLSFAGGACHLAAGLSGLAPGGMYRAAQGVNNASSMATGGRMNGLMDLARFDPSNADGLDKIGRVGSDLFGGAGRSTDAVGGIFNDRKGAVLTKQGSLTERYKMSKQEIDQESQQAGGRVDSASNKQQERERGRHEIFMALARG